MPHASYLPSDDYICKYTEAENTIGKSFLKYILKSGSMLLASLLEE